MPRLQCFAIPLFVLAVHLPALAEPVFKVVPSTIATAEGGSENVLLIQAGDDHFSIQIPKDYGAEVIQESRSIVFTAGSGLSLITIQVTTNYSGALPKMEELSGIVAKKYPAATLLQSSPCVTDYAPGLCFDLVRHGPNNLTLRISDAYVSYPAGSIEFIFSCNGADYEKNRLGFVWLLNSFRSQTKPVKKEP